MQFGLVLTGAGAAPFISALAIPTGVLSLVLCAVPWLMPLSQ
ncbi:hypothetical protein [Pseudomonas chlororaphis]|nr:hypothetical protein [Pseudomonas chlororaphis]